MKKRNINVKDKRTSRISNSNIALDSFKVILNYICIHVNLKYKFNSFVFLIKSHASHNF